MEASVNDHFIEDAMLSLKYRQSRVNRSSRCQADASGKFNLTLREFQTAER